MGGGGEGEQKQKHVVSKNCACGGALKAAGPSWCVCVICKNICSYVCGW